MKKEQIRAKAEITSAYYAMDVSVGGALSRRRLKGSYEHIEIFLSR